MNTFNLIAARESASIDLPHAAISELVVCSLPICIPPINAIQYHFLIVTTASVHTVRATFAQQRCLGTSHKYEDHLKRYFGARVALPQLVGSSSESTSLDANHRQ